ncbi:MAG TPA: glycosyltransferase family 1 protein [Bacteroides sp.]|nr:glycosyltransferase family 1 protein [Bacteroides sp.]
MKILYLIDNFSLGGAQSVVRGLMERDPGNGDVHAMALRAKDPEYTIVHPNAVCFQSRSKFSLRPLRQLDKMIREEKIGVLHCQLPRSIVFGYLLKRKHPGIRYIIHEQGDVFESRMYALLLRMIAVKADGIIACSEATRRAMEERSRIAANRVEVLYNFVDPERFSPGGRQAGTIAKIAFAGRIEKRKGWREFVQAAAYFCFSEKLSFLMAGTGSEDRLLLRMIGKQACPNIRFTGYQPSMEAFYRDADLVVIPSHAEPMGMVAIEAMACGTPVLAADVPGLNEIVRHGLTGWTYPLGPVTELITAIETILECPQEELQAVIRRGREHALAFSLAIFAERLREFYRIHME